MDFAASGRFEPTAAGWEEAIAEAPDQPAVFLVETRQGQPYLSRSGFLRRRLRALLRAEGRSKRLNLREAAAAVDYWLTPSRLESSLVFYSLARRYFPDSYTRYVKLRMPPYLKVTLGNTFPRTLITTRLTGGPSIYFGPFRSRTRAEQFESGFLDLFQLRRCQQDLEPAADHPGCIYGEMGRCLRPCQLVVTPEGYASEARRAVEFLETQGRSLSATLEESRDRLSAELRFEDAARVHKRLEQVERVLREKDELPAFPARLHAAVVTPGAAAHAVRIWLVLGGCWTPPLDFDYESGRNRPVSLDAQLRELTATVQSPRLSILEQQEHLALLARWFYSSWRDGLWIPMPDPAAIPYRRLVRAISHLAASAHGSTSHSEPKLG
jgi:excinuclease ABC subunit C